MILHADLDGEPHDRHFDYRSVIGKLNYLEKSTQPDIGFAVHQCAFISIPTKLHAAAVKRIGQYLLRTNGLGYKIAPQSEAQLRMLCGCLLCGGVGQAARQAGQH